VTHFSFLAAALLVSAAAVSAQAADTDPPATAVAPAAIFASPAAPARAVQNAHDPNRVICKREEEIGTRLGGYKACHTFAQWDQIAHNGGAVVNAVQAMSSHSNPKGN